MRSEEMTAGSSPRFVNPGNFMRMERYEDTEGLDFAIYGIPFDTASSYRTGARFGPQAIRNISVMIKPINPVHQVDLFEQLKGGDLGDVNIVPGYIHPTYDAIEEFAADIIKAGQLRLRSEATIRSRWENCGRWPKHTGQSVFCSLTLMQI